MAPRFAEKAFDNPKYKYNVYFICKHNITQYVSYKIEFGSTNDRSVKHTRAFRIQGTLPCKFLRGMLITKCSDVDYIAKAYCRSLSKVQRVSVEASVSVVAHSYEGEDAANLLKGRSHIGGPSCRRQESERQFKKALFWNAPDLLVFICTSNDWTFCNFTTLACSKRERLRPLRTPQNPNGFAG